MSARTPRRTAVVSGIALVGVTAALAAPGAAAAETVDGDVSVTSTETVSVQMGADGKAGKERVYEQLVLDGKGSVDLSNPVSTKNLRNLDGFGGWEVVDGVQRVKTDVDGEQKYRSVSDFDGDLPVDVDIQYTFDGRRVQPGDVVGKDGELQVVYTVRNATGKTQDVTFTDGEGKVQTVQQAVVIPMVGSMTVVLPSNFTDVRPDGANSAGDGKGGTQLSFTMTLFPPIGSDRATFGYTAHVVDGVIPKASMSLLPVNPLENNSFKGGAASYQGGATKGADLTAGAVTIDENLLKIRDGADKLVAGILKLRDGAQQLNTGLSGKAAPGAGQLADGASQLDAGANKLDAGANKLAAGATRLGAGTGLVAGGAISLDEGATLLRDGSGRLAAGLTDLDKGATRLRDGSGLLATGAGDLDAGVGTLQEGTGKLAAGAGALDAGATKLATGLQTAAAGAPALVGGLTQVQDGLKLIDSGLTTFGSTVSVGAGKINGGASDLLAAVNGQLVPGLTSVEGALDQALSIVATLPDGAQKTGLQQAIGGAKTGVGTVKGGLSTSVATGLTGIRDGAAQIKGGADAQTSAAAAATDGTLKNGLAKALGGLGEILTKSGPLVEGIKAASSGANDLATGAGSLAKGSSDLDTGAGALRDGTTKLKTGAGDLATGAAALKGGSSQLSAGAGDLAGGLVELKSGTSALRSGAGTVADGAGTLADGTITLAAGTGTLIAGSGKLSLGAGTLASGIKDAADGSGKIADGLETAAESAPALPEGAQKLSDQGTSQLVNVGNGTAKDFGLKYALIEAGAARAAEAQPYGSPDGAFALTAYKIDIAGENGEASANTNRGIAIAVLAAGALGLAALRRRMTPA